MSFDGKTIMITGAAGNLGRAVAKAFAAEGAQLVLVDLHTGGLEGEFADSEHHLFVKADLSQIDDALAASQEAVVRFGRIDVLCNLTGAFRMGEAVHETSSSIWDFLFRLNAGSVLHMARAVVPRMLEEGAGKIVNVGAFSAQRGVAHMGAYAASKSVVVRLTESMAAELRDKNINVNCVLPTIIDTPENRLAMPDADPTRWVAPQDLANAILFLASDQARAVHGASLPVCGLS